MATFGNVGNMDINQDTRIPYLCLINGLIGRKEETLNSLQYIKNYYLQEITQLRIDAARAMTQEDLEIELSDIKREIQEDYPDVNWDQLFESLQKIIDGHNETSRARTEELNKLSIDKVNLHYQIQQLEKNIKAIDAHLKIIDNLAKTSNAKRSKLIIEKKVPFERLKKKLQLDLVDKNRKKNNNHEKLSSVEYAYNLVPSSKPATGEEFLFSDSNLLRMVVNPGLSNEVVEKIGIGYVDAKIISVLTSKSSNDDVKKISLEDKYNLLWITETLFESVSETEEVTLREFALGAPYRKETSGTFFNPGKQIERITPKNRQTPMAIRNALENGSVRTGIERGFFDDLDKLANNEACKRHYSEYAKQKLYSIVATTITTSDIGGRPFLLARLLFAGVLKEQVLVFKKKVVPGIVVIGTESVKLLVSIETGKSIEFTETDRSQNLADFIHGHFSIYDQRSVTKGEIVAQRVTEDLAILNQYGIPPYKEIVKNPDVAFQDSSDVFGKLWDAKLDQLKHNLDRYVYTPAEGAENANIQFWLGVSQALDLLLAIALVQIPGGIGVAASLASGLGIGLLDSHLKDRQAEFTDQGHIFREAQEEAEFGRSVIKYFIAPDVVRGLFLLGKNAGAGVRAFTREIKAMKDGVRAMAELRGKTSRARSHWMATRGVENRWYRDKVHPPGTKPMDAVLTVQRLSGEISQEEAAQLGRSVRDFLTGEGKEVRDLDELLRLEDGWRVALINEENNEVLEAYYSLGNGRMAGLNNSDGQPATLLSEWVEIDLSDSKILTFTDGNAQLIRGEQKIRIMVDTQATEFRMESMRDIGIDVPSLGDAKISNFLAEMKDDSNVKKYISTSIQKSEEALLPVAAYMRKKGFTDIKYRCMHIWSKFSESAPHNHFLVMGTYEGKVYAFDVTAHKFSWLGLNDALLVSEVSWANTVKSAASDNGLLIKIQDFSAPITMENTLSLYSYPPGKYIEGAQRLTDPIWYKRGLNALGPLSTAEKEASKQLSRMQMLTEAFQNVGVGELIKSVDLSFIEKILLRAKGGFTENVDFLPAFLADELKRILLNAIFRQQFQIAKNDIPLG